MRLSIKALRSDLAGPFDLELAVGGCAVVMGPSGSGKSLFLRMIADLDPNVGEVRLEGEERAAFAAPDWRRRVTYVAAEAGWWDARIVDHFAHADRQAAQALAVRLGLAADQMEAEVGRLSTGERQRFALVRALVLGPPVLLLDEPTGALDQASVEKVEAVLRERLGQGTSVVMVTHDEALGRRIASRIYRMNDRRLSAE